LLEHERFEELASLAAIGELSGDEHGEFVRHLETCGQCREIIAATSSLAGAAFLAGVPVEQDPITESDRQRRARESVAQRLPVVVPASYSIRQKRLISAGIAAALVFGVGVGGVAGSLRVRAATARNARMALSTGAVGESPRESPSLQSETSELQAAVVDLQKQVTEARNENHALREELVGSDEHATELENRVDALADQGKAREQEVAETRDALNAARAELSQSQTLIASDQTTIGSFQVKLADREDHLKEVSDSLDRERDMLSAGREVRDIMGARELHIVDVFDTDGKGHTKKPFGRAFYTQGKSLIFYAFDLPTKSTADGKFVYAAWGSNSNKLKDEAPHSLGIFYNDDQAQHRWAMKFDNPQILEEIDTVFVTLEPAENPHTVPTSKSILEAYFGTPPNHP
jgi:predicted  nucleic acid-binding Zn-ribbon protein